MVSAATREAMDTTRYFVSLEFVFRLMSASLDRGFLPALVREMTFAPRCFAICVLSTTQRELPEWLTANTASRSSK